MEWNLDLVCFLAFKHFFSYFILWKFNLSAKIVFGYFISLVFMLYKCNLFLCESTFVFECFFF